MLSKSFPFRTSFFLLFVLCVLSGDIFSQWDTYPTYDEYISMMSKFETDYPELCRIVDIGESAGGKKLLCAKITDSITTNEAEPEFFYGATLNGNEPVGFVLLLRLIDYLCTNYGTDTLVTRLVDSVEIWINPLGNPDDLYITHPVEPDLNRNHPCPCMQGNHEFYGMYNSWEPETKAFLDFAEKHNFVMGADLHSGIECAVWPFASIRERPVDSLWYKMVAEQYRDLAQANGPANYFNFSGGAVSHYFGLYEAHGIRIDYLAYHNHCRALQLELSNEKMPDASTLPDYWDYNHKALLNYMDQVRYSVRGTVTDSELGWPLEAKVFVEYHDKDSSHVYSHLPHGDYYLPLYRGNYNITFSREQYYSKTYHNVAVYNNQASILNAKLVEITNISYIQENEKALFSVSMNSSSKIAKISFDLKQKGKSKLQIYNIKGRLLSTLVDSYKQAGKYTINFDRTMYGAGVYYIRLSAGNNSIVRKSILLK